MKKDNRKKKIIIEIAVAGVLLLALAVAIIVDTLSTRSTVLLTEDQAQTLLNDTFENLPLTGAVTAAGIIDGANVTVNSVRYGGSREMIFSCTYETSDVLGVYKANKDSLFSDAYDYCEELRADGQMVNATKVRLFMDERITQLISEAEKVNGEIEISVYEVNASVAEGDIFAAAYEDTFLRVYLSDELLNTLFGGIVDISADIVNTEEFVYNGETVSIESQMTLKNGIRDCFGLRNFSTSKPDSSSFFLSKWNSFCDEFYRNFIYNAQWKYLASGLGTTLAITLLSALLGILIGFVCAIVRCTYDKTGKLMLADQVVRLYLSVVRGTPVMIQLMIIYFVLLLPVGIEKFPAAVLCFGINSGAYVAEIVRGGIMSVDNGQNEAGRSLGLNYIQTMYYIIVPQAFKAVLPSLANEFITLLKESSVAFYIGVADLTQGGLKIRSITYSNFMPLLAVALIYLVMVLILTKLVGILERKLRKDER